MDPIFKTFDSLFENPQDLAPNPQISFEKPQNPSEKLDKFSYLKPLPDLHKLKPLSLHKKNIILLLYGSFYPIHNNHIRALNFSKSFIEGNHDLHQKFHIIGGFLMPTHMNSLKKKIGKPLLDNEIRLELCKEALFESEWITFLPILSKQKTNIGIVKAMKFLTDYVNFYMKNKKNKQKISIVSILGDDNLEIIEKNINKREFFIIIQNRPQKTQKDLTFWLNSEKISPYKENIIIVIDEKVPFETNSTEIRNLVSSSTPLDQEKLAIYLPSRVYSYLLLNKIIFPIPMPYQKPKIFEEKPINQINQPIKSFEEIIGFEIPLKIQFSELISSINLHKIGQGLQAAVYSMNWQKPEEKKSLPVAVKITDLSSDRGRKVKAYIRDLRALLLCDHKNVVKFYGAGMDGNKMFIVMEKALGVNTWTFIQEQRKTWEDKSKMPRKWFKYLAELAEGLENMSENGVLHRDLQLNNILIFERSVKNNENEKNEQNLKIEQNDSNLKIKLNEKNEENEKKEQKQNKKNEKESNEIFIDKKTKIDYNIDQFLLKICDFGVSALENDKHLVVRGSTRHYAPEAIEDKNMYVSASDVYSFGNMMYEIVNGRKVFIEYSVEQMQIKVKLGERPSFMKGSDQRLKGVIDKCWEQDWKKRPSFKEVANMLHMIYNENLD